MESKKIIDSWRAYTKSDILEKELERRARDFTGEGFEKNVLEFIEDKLKQNKIDVRFLLNPHYSIRAVKWVHEILMLEKNNSLPSGSIMGSYIESIDPNDLKQLYEDSSDILNNERLREQIKKGLRRLYSTTSEQ